MAKVVGGDVAKENEHRGERPHEDAHLAMRKVVEPDRQSRERQQENNNQSRTQRADFA